MTGVPTDILTTEANLEPSRVLSNHGLENLTVFCRLLGYVRHFHPSDQAAQTSWEAFAVSGVRYIENCAEVSALLQALHELFRPIAPTIQIFAGDEQPAHSPHLSARARDLKVVTWQHHGAGQVAPPQSVYQSHRIWFEAAAVNASSLVANPAKPFIANLGAGLSAAVPLALYADAHGTLPRIEYPKRLLDNDIVYSGNDRATRLAAVMLGWNILQHFYPYFDVAKVDWLQELPKALTAAAIDPDEVSFLQSLRRLVAALHDGHGAVNHTCEPDLQTLPIVWKWIEDHLVIVSIAPDVAGSDVRIGDVVASIDGRPSLEAIQDLEQLVSAASPPLKRLGAISWLTLGPPGSCARLRLVRDGTQEHEVELSRYSMLLPYAGGEARPSITAELKHGVQYFDLTRGTDSEFEAALPQLAVARGLILDLRGYPKVSMTFLQHLTDAPLSSAMWHIPIISKPDHLDRVYIADRWQLEPLRPRITAKVVILTDERAISFAETMLAIVEAYKLAEIVGSTTAGTNGNIVRCTLPGRYDLVWTGLRVLKHDGSEHHGNGVRPTVTINRTLKGVSEGRDEVLERAVEIISDQLD
jgi:C-terminal processing protease CtpA/Prc